MTNAHTTDWSPLDRELAIWQAHGLTLPLWWRDDDAIAPTPQLDQLQQLSEDLRLPVHLAVIPKGATTALADRIPGSTLIPVVHGWAHENHAPPGHKKAEFGDHRPLPETLRDAEDGLSHLQELFGAALVPMFVPPWNRFAPDLATGLAALGYTSLSTFTPRRSPLAAPGLEQINTHLDPIDWKGSRSLVSPDRLIAQVARDLEQRRTGETDADEPYGILTHHLVHDPAIWGFTKDLLTRLLAGPARAASLQQRNIT